MADHDLPSPDNPEFPGSSISAPSTATSIWTSPPTPEEAAALARLMGALAVRKMRLRGRLTPLPKGWQLDATLGATVVQPCVVTLEPVTTRVDQPVRRRYLPMAERGTAVQQFDAEDDDDVEPLGERIDIGLVATEALALALPAYPRKPGASLGPAGFAPGAAAPTWNRKTRG